MTEVKSEVKRGVLEGLMNGFMMREFWDKETARAPKDTEYMIGTLVSGVVNPSAFITFGRNLAEGNYIVSRRK